MKTPLLTINTQKGLLTEATFYPSPHQDDRPLESAIDMIVIHGISLPPGEFGSSAILEFFGGKLDPTAHPYFAEIAHLQVSAHLLVRRDGEIIQFVPFTKRAWHAGESSFQGKTRCNDFSIGIELEGTDHFPYDKRQYQQLSNVIKLLMKAYPAITPARIVGHETVAPQRKTDPGPAFDWLYLKGMMA
jgi:N-acetyl-anhydromuramoyl-L-alanine amidase